MNRRKLIASVLPSFERELTCERCGQPFVSGASLEGCWCADIKLSEPVGAELWRSYHACLCRACLEQVAQGTSERKSEGA